MEETVSSHNGVSGRANIVKKRCCKFCGRQQAAMLCCHFNILCFFHSFCPEGVIISITQNMVLISREKLLNGEIVGFIINEDGVKHVGNFEGVIKTTSSTIVNGDGKFDFLSVFACSSGESSKKVNQFVIRGGV